MTPMIAGISDGRRNSKRQRLPIWMTSAKFVKWQPRKRNTQLKIFRCGGKMEAAELPSLKD